MPQLGIAIWTVNVINGVFSFWQEYKAENATEALRRLFPTYARVLRDGEEQRISPKSWCLVTFSCLPKATTFPPTGAWFRHPTCVSTNRH